MRLRCCLSGLCLLVLMPAFAQDPLVLGNQRELLVDQYLVESMDAIQHVLNTPTPMNVAIKFDQPWEGRYCGYVTVIKDGADYKLFYRGIPTSGNDGRDGEVACYAESKDGINWTKPELGLFEHDGSTANNIIVNEPPYTHNFAPFLDANPEAAADARYKAVGGTSKSGLKAFASPDGIHWRAIQDTPIITEGAFDSQNVAFWSAHEQQYVCYLRTWSESKWGGFRSISRCTSRDFVHWTTPKEMDYGDTTREHLYTNQTTPYFAAPHIYIALAARFMPGRRVATEAEAKAFGVESTYSGDCSDSVFMSSRGGYQYDRTFMEGFITPGIGLENWTSRTNYTARGIVPIDDKTMSIYVQERYGQPTAQLRRYTMRQDGFAGFKAPYSGGSWTSKVLQLDGDALNLNFSTSAAGGIKVEIQEADGSPIPGYSLDECTELIGNHINRAGQWEKGSDIKNLANQSIRLHFVMKDATLYALQAK